MGGAKESARCIYRCVRQARSSSSSSSFSLWARVSVPQAAGAQRRQLLLQSRALADVVAAVRVSAAVLVAAGVGGGEQRRGNAMRLKCTMELSLSFACRLLRHEGLSQLLLLRVRMLLLWAALVVLQQQHAAASRYPGVSPRQRPPTGRILAICLQQTQSSAS